VYNTPQHPHTHTHTHTRAIYVLPHTYPAGRIWSISATNDSAQPIAKCQALLSASRRGWPLQTVTEPTCIQIICTSNSPRRTTQFEASRRCVKAPKQTLMTEQPYWKSLFFLHSSRFDTAEVRHSPSLLSLASCLAGLGCVNTRGVERRRGLHANLALGRGSIVHLQK